MITNTVAREIRFYREIDMYSNWRRGWDRAGHFLGQRCISKHQQMRVHIVQGLINERQFSGLALRHAMLSYQCQVSHSQHQSRHPGF